MEKKDFVPEDIKTELHETIKKHYLSNEFAENDFKSWRYDEHILIIANAGDGKTTLMLDRFTAWADKQGKSVLYLFNRNAMKAQFAEKKANEQDNLSICSYQAIEEHASGIGIQGYINSFDYVLCDECHYFVNDAAFNEKTFFSYEAINNCIGTAIYFTATPKYFLAMKHKLTKPLRIIDKTNLNPKNLQKIYIARNKDTFNAYEEKLLTEQKVIHFENNILGLKQKEEKYLLEGYNAGILVSEYSSKSFFMNREIAKQIKESTDENGCDIANVFTDWLGCTSAYENGVNFNIEGKITVSFAKYINWTSLEQSCSRIRDFGNNSVNMLICIPHQNFFRSIALMEPSKIKSLEKGQEKTNRNAAFGADAYNKYNDFRIAYQKIKLEEIEELLKAENTIDYYKKKLHELYPNAAIEIIELIDTEEYFNNILDGKNEVLITNEQKKQIKNDLKVLKLDRKNPNNPVGLKKIKEFLRISEMPFEIKNGRATINGKQESVWLLKRL